MATPNIALRIPTQDKKELERLAAEAGVTLADALRNGAHLYLAALTMPRSRKGVKLGAN